MDIQEFIQTLNNKIIPLDEMEPVVLGLYCYKQMSDKLEYYMNKVLLKREYVEELFDEELWIELKAGENGECIEEDIKIADDIKIEFRDINKTKYAQEYPKIKVFTKNYLRYFIEPDYLFSELIYKLNRKQEVFDDIKNALNDLSEQLVMFTEIFNAIEEENVNLDKFNIFQNINLKIFEDEKEILYDLMLNMHSLNSERSSESEIIADYESIQEYFRKKSFKTTPNNTTSKSISQIIAKLVAPQIKKEYVEIYDPAFGIGSTFIEILKETDNLSKNSIPTLSTYSTPVVISGGVTIYANEINQATYNQAIMNMIIHNIPFYDFDITNTDTIENPVKYNRSFKIITSDIPLGLRYDGDIDKLSKDNRYKEYAKLPKRNADYFFILDMLYNLSDNGTIVTTITPGTLFAQGVETELRKQLIEKNYVDAIIQLAPKTNHNTNISPIILIMKKQRKTKDILFIDASKEYEKQGHNHVLSEENISKIIDTYFNRKQIDKFSYIAGIDEIKANNYNLAIKLYVDTFEEEEIDIEITKKELQQVQRQIKSNDEKIEEFFKDKENTFLL